MAEQRDPYDLTVRTMDDASMMIQIMTAETHCNNGEQQECRQILRTILEAGNLTLMQTAYMRKILALSFIITAQTPGDRARALRHAKEALKCLEKLAVRYPNYEPIETLMESISDACAVMEEGTGFWETVKWGLGAVVGFVFSRKGMAEL